MRFEFRQEVWDLNIFYIYSLKVIYIMIFSIFFFDYDLECFIEDFEKKGILCILFRILQFYDLILLIYMKYIGLNIKIEIIKQRQIFSKNFVIICLFKRFYNRLFLFS